MTCRIFKYKLELVDEQWLQTKHRVVKVLSVAEQDGELCLWAVMDSSETHDRRQRRIFIVGTGNPFPVIGTGSFIGTVLMSDGLVWHVFEEQRL